MSEHKFTERISIDADDAFIILDELISKLKEANEEISKLKSNLSDLKS
ncbi:hypothetical protein [Lactobacillus sp. ESL0677]|nr:hypothetical protein [Lactobacillus sp. ESL0677]WEV37698.1 hypothetical protein OZX76_03865 [Lactobacillus sp. ESL0677]